METIPMELIILLMVVQVFWELPWKGVALWKSAQLSHKSWFIILFLLNSMGILPIIYLRFIAKKYKVEIKDVSKDSK